MKRMFFQNLEQAACNHTLPLTTLINELAFNEQGLVPVIAQDTDSGEVLMLAWMNKASLKQTLATGRMTYWSRSRNALWIKGDTSGHYQQLQSLRIDCDAESFNRGLPVTPHAKAVSTSKQTPPTTARSLLAQVNGLLGIDFKLRQLHYVGRSSEIILLDRRLHHT